VIFILLEKNNSLHWT